MAQQLPIGYVGFTVPYPIEFFSGIGGRIMPYYDPETEQLWVDNFAGALVWGFEYVLSHHFIRDNVAQAFPSATAVVQRVTWDATIEWSDGVVQPHTVDMFEELRLYGSETLDIHAYYNGYREVPIRRVEMGMLVQSAVMDQAFQPSENHSQLRDLAPDEFGFFRDSLTLDTYDYWQFTLNDPPTPTHRHTWWSSTYDPAQGGATTWNSGAFSYTADSAAKRAESKEIRWQRPQVVNRASHRMQVGKRTVQLVEKEVNHGVARSHCALEFSDPYLRATLQIGGGKVETIIDESGVRVADVPVQLGRVREPAFKRGHLILPDRGFYMIAFSSLAEFHKFIKPRVYLYGWR